MNEIPQFFPFGEPLKKVEQIDIGTKKAFILGVYASAVHAKWFSPDHKLIVKALAVASEPYIFWTGDQAKDIISRISIPDAAGYLQPADERFNGPSGRALDKLYLSPLNLSRKNVWLADLVPYSCVNDSQWNALILKYFPVAKKLELPKPTIGKVPKKLTDSIRREQILQELIESKCETIVLLGDKPIEYFLARVSNCKQKNLSSFVDDYGYGHPCQIKISSRPYNVIPLAHPRQSDSLGKSSIKWKMLHDEWIRAQRLSKIESHV